MVVFVCFLHYFFDSKCLNTFLNKLFVKTCGWSKIRGREGGRDGEGGEEAEARENIRGGAKVKTSELCF